MSLVVLSNTGPWDTDMVGVVGVIDSVANFLKHVQEYGGYTEEQILNAKVISSKSEIDSLYEKNELSCFSDGETILAVVIKDDNEYEDFYFVDQF